MSGAKFWIINCPPDVPQEERAKAISESGLSLAEVHEWFSNPDEGVGFDWETGKFFKYSTVGLAEGEVPKALPSRTARR
jgi:hypothetical protein